MPKRDAPTVAYRVPRCRWPAVWNLLHDRRAPFTTTRCAPHVGGHVDLLVTPADAGVLGHLAQRLEAARDPWPPKRLRARQGRDAWAALGDAGELADPPPEWDDALADAVLAAMGAP